MDIESRLAHIVEERNLLQHPFYQAWSAGTLPVTALQTYAREYGAFIGKLPEGWQTLGDAETAREEREHAELWDGFAAALETRVGEAWLPAVRGLIDTTRALFAEPASAVGALYAFEAQQPATAKSKLAGLKAFYRLPASVEPYFEVHSRNEHEARKLLGLVRALPASQQERAAQACRAMTQALWDALSGIYDEACAKN